MAKYFEEKLAAEFPFMVRHDPCGNMYDKAGCQCIDGWYNLIRQLCREIMDIYAKYNAEPDIIVDQVKEKFGVLKFYYHFEGEKPRIHAIDFLGSGTSIRFRSGKNDLQREIAEAVANAEKKSESTCEICGRYGKLRGVRGFVQTLCDDHYIEKLRFYKRITFGELEQYISRINPFTVAIAGQDVSKEYRNVESWPHELDGRKVRDIALTGNCYTTEYNAKMGTRGDTAVKFVVSESDLGPDAEQDELLRDECGITFGSFRRCCYPFQRVSICMKDTLMYENYERVYDVPDSYNNMYLYGFGPILSEIFKQVRGEHYCTHNMDMHLEIVLADRPKEEIERREAKG